MTSIYDAVVSKTNISCRDISLMCDASGVQTLLEIARDSETLGSLVFSGLCNQGSDLRGAFGTTGRDDKAYSFCLYVGLLGYASALWLGSDVGSGLRYDDAAYAFYYFFKNRAYNRLNGAEFKRFLAWFGYNVRGLIKCFVARCGYEFTMVA